jgi:uridine kinase
MRVLITGAAGSGTSTLAVTLAEHWGAAAVDADSFLWLPTDPPFSIKRDPEQCRALFEQQLRSHERIVVAGSVVGWGVDALFDLVVFLYVEAAVRVRRLQAREVERFGKADPAFLEWAAQYDEGSAEGRSLAKHEAWLRTLHCPVIRLVGVSPIEDQLAVIAGAVPNSSIERTVAGKPPVAAQVKR